MVLLTSYPGYAVEHDCHLVLEVVCKSTSAEAVRENR